MITSEMKNMLLKEQIINEIYQIKKEMEELREEIKDLSFAIRESRMESDL